MDLEAEEKHGKLATEPEVDIHMRKNDNDDIEVLMWLDGKRYYGIFKED